jgi:CubicO group peptidase (beta-lactamase class C family)
MRRDARRSGVGGVVALLVVSGSASTLECQTYLPTVQELAGLDREVQARLLGNNIPGAVIAVASRGEILRVATYGLADVELDVPVSDSSVFEIGSLSKQFVAVASLQLVAEGTLDLDASIHQYLPWLPGEWRGATARHLLNHTSGIPDYEAIQGYYAYRNRSTATEIVASAQSLPMDFPPGLGTPVLQYGLLHPEPRT